jgi:hypothetical protein
MKITELEFQGFSLTSSLSVKRYLDNKFYFNSKSDNKPLRAPRNALGHRK